MASGAPRQPAARKKAAPTQMSSSRGNTKGQGQGQRGQAEEPVPGSAWQPRETIALYSVQSRVDVTAPDFWDIVSDDLAEMDVFRTAEECQQRWFEVSTFYTASSVLECREKFFCSVSISIMRYFPSKLLIENFSLCGKLRSARE